MKTLVEINDNYIKEMVEFFCYEYYKMYIKKSGDNTAIIFDLVNGQIKKRLPHLLSDWKLEIHKDYTVDKSIKRDNLISHILEGEDLKHPPMYFKFMYQQTKGLEIKILDIVIQL